MRPYDDLFALRMIEAFRFPLADAYCRALDAHVAREAPNRDDFDTASAVALRATYVDQLDRLRVARGIPSIFAFYRGQP